MRIQILACERDQQVVVRDDKGEILFDSIQTYDELGSAGRDAVKEVVTDLANVLKIPVEEDEVEEFE